MTNTHLSFDELRAAHELGEAIARIIKVMAPKTPPPRPPNLPPAPLVPQSLSPESPDLLSAREAAKLLNVSSRTLWSISHPRGQVRTVRLGRRVLYPRTALQEWIRSNISR